MSLAECEDHNYMNNARLKVLHIVLNIGETNAAYNEHCLPMCTQREIAICTFFAPAIQAPSAIRIFAGDGSFRGFFRALMAALKASTYDVIHAHSPHVALLFLVFAAARDRSLSQSMIVTVHDSYPNYKLRNRLLFLPVFANASRVVCCSRSSFESVPRLHRFLAGRRLEYIQNGLNIARIDRIAATCRRRDNSDTFNLIALGRLVENKNLLTVLHAFNAAIDPRLHLVYVGDGPLRSSLAEACASAGIQRQVTFTGLLPRDQAFERVMAADLFISASRGEGLPVAVLEAMACGCPVLLSDIPPHREIADGASFIPLIDPDDESGFAREIRKFRAMDPSERAAVGRECRRIVEQRFSLDAMHARYEVVYKEIVRHTWTQVQHATTAHAN